MQKSRAGNPLGSVRIAHYIGDMERSAGHWNRYLVGTAIFMAAALATGAAFAGWLNNSADILLTYASAGLAWCF